MDGVILPQEWYEWLEQMKTRGSVIALPSAADLDAVAEEERIKEQTSAKVSNR